MIKSDAKVQLKRVRTICLALPGTSERLSHGEPTFFAGKKVFAMFANDHHGDGHVGVWVPAPVGVQELLIEGAPRAYYRPPYVGVKGWVGIELARVSDARLEHHLHEAWRMVAPKRDRDAMGTPKAGVPVSRRRASRRTPARRTTDRSP